MEGGRGKEKRQRVEVTGEGPCFCGQQRPRRGVWEIRRGASRVEWGEGRGAYGFDWMGVGGKKKN